MAENNTITFTVTFYKDKHMFSVDVDEPIPARSNEFPYNQYSPQVAFYVARVSESPDKCYIYYWVNGVQRKKEVP
jgi:hypothetical protein